MASKPLFILIYLYGLAVGTWNQKPSEY